MIFLIIFYFSTKETNETKNISSEPTGTIKYCSSSLSFSLSGNGTCNLTASISTNSCENNKYELRNNDIKCSGIIKNIKEVVFCSWQVPFGNYTYNLYIDNELKDSRFIECPEIKIPCLVCSNE
jgi:hypothetical protein